MDFEQYDIKSSSGLYFEQLSDVQLYHSEWTFVTYVNLSYFTVESEHFERTVLKIQNFCDKIREEFPLPIPSSYCDQTTPQLFNLLEEVREYSTKWFTNNEFSSESRYENEFRPLRKRSLKRKKRGFLGTIAKSVFGTLSETEGAFYMDQINALKSENVEHMLITEKQTSLFQESLKVLNSTMQSQNIQNAVLQNYFDDLSVVLKNQTVEAATDHVSSILTAKLSELMQYTSFLMIGFREKQRYFFEAITTKSRSFQMIPPRMFLSELQRVSLLVARQGLMLPMPLTGENLSKFYQLTTTEGRIVDNNLVVRFSIPLVESKKFILFKATSAPYRNETNDTFKYIVPRHEYIAVDSFQDTFVTLTLDELRHCHRINGQHLVCKQTFPIMTATNNLGCEINLLRKTNSSSDCDVRTANLTEELWVQLQQPNTYLYTLPKSQPVVVLCSNSRTSIFLEGTGVISVAQKCRIKTERVEIVAFQTIESKIFRNFGASSKNNVSVSDEMNKAKGVKSLTVPDIQLQNVTNGLDPNQVSQMNGDLNDLKMQNAIDKASAVNLLNKVMDDSNGIGRALLALAVVGAAIAIVFTCLKYSVVKGGHLLIFVILVALSVATILNFL